MTQPRRKLPQPLPYPFVSQHSAATPAMWSQIGFDAMVVNRIHHQLKNTYKEHGNMEFVWDGADQLGTGTTMFTHVLHTHYSAPKGYDWEERSATITGSNVESKALQLVNAMRKRAAAYKTSQLLMPFGDDFKFKDAKKQFSNMDQLVNEVKQHPDKYPGVTLRYSTLSEYFTAVSRESLERDVTFNVYRGDFFPYADNEESYWTGYYSTRPHLKILSRELERVGHAAEMLYALSRALRLQSPATFKQQLVDLRQARRDRALFLHHDAITGTSRDKVVADYELRMGQGRESLHRVLERALESLLAKDANTVSGTHAQPQLTTDPYVLAAAASGDALYPVIVHNSLAWDRQELQSLKVDSPHVRVEDSSGTPVRCQLDHELDLEAQTPTRRFVLHFLAEAPALGAATYFVHIAPPSADNSAFIGCKRGTSTALFEAAGGHIRGQSAGQQSDFFVADSSPSEQSINNEAVAVTVSSTGLLASVRDLTQSDAPEMQLVQSFGVYGTKSSGAYLFRPVGARKSHNSPPDKMNGFFVTRGPLVDSVYARTGDFDTSTVLVKGCSSLSRHVSSVSHVQASKNQEIVQVFSSGLANSGGRFSTHNGLSFMRRTTKPDRPEMNYAPCVWGSRLHGAADTEGAERLTFYTQHSMACGSQREGEMEFLVHRNLGQDDGRGLAQQVADRSRVAIPLLIALDGGVDKVDRASFATRALRFNHPLTVLLPVAGSLEGVLPGGSFSKDEQVEQWRTKHHLFLSPLASPLPADVHLLSLLAQDNEMSEEDEVGLRLHRVGEGAPVTVQVSKLFAEGLRLQGAKRVSLTLNQEIDVNVELGDLAAPLIFKYSGELGLADETLEGVDSDNQNSDEAGVFLSQAALDKLAEDAAESEAERLLRERRERFDAHGGGEARVHNSFARHLLSTDDDAASVQLHGLELASFTARLTSTSGGLGAGVGDAMHPASFVRADGAVSGGGTGAGQPPDASKPPRPPPVVPAVPQAQPPVDAPQAPVETPKAQVVPQAPEAPPARGPPAQQPETPQDQVLQEAQAGSPQSAEPAWAAPQDRLNAEEREVCILCA